MVLATLLSPLAFIGCGPTLTPQERAKLEEAQKQAEYRRRNEGERRVLADAGQWDKHLRPESEALETDRFPSTAAGSSFRSDGSMCRTTTKVGSRATAL